MRSIQSTLGIGKIYNQGKDGIQLRVESLKELLILITHFDNYPLITRKRFEFICFKKAILLIKNKKHLTKEGLIELVSLRASMGKGLTKELKAVFPDLILIDNRSDSGGKEIDTNLTIDPN